MTCYQIGDAWVCVPPRGVVRRHVLRCPLCERRTRHVERFMGVYYPSHLTCVRCGDTWSEGWLFERPFQRGWRVKAQAKARQEWRDALSPADFQRRIHAQLDESLGSAA